MAEALDVGEAVFPGRRETNRRVERRRWWRRCASLDGPGDDALTLVGEPAVLAKTKAALDELMSRDLSTLTVAALMVDGVRVRGVLLRGGAGHLRRRNQGPSRPVAGDTENTTVVTRLQADLVDRGLSAVGGLLVVIGGGQGAGPGGVQGLR
jgi:hypothetical protein